MGTRSSDVAVVVVVLLVAIHGPDQAVAMVWGWTWEDPVAWIAALVGCWLAGRAVARTRRRRGDDVPGSGEEVARAPGHGRG